MGHQQCSLYSPTTRSRVTTNGWHAVPSPYLTYLERLRGRLNAQAGKERILRLGVPLKEDQRRALVQVCIGTVGFQRDSLGGVGQRQLREMLGVQTVQGVGLGADGGAATVRPRQAEAEGMRVEIEGGGRRLVPVRCVLMLVKLCYNSNDCPARGPSGLSFLTHMLIVAFCNTLVTKILPDLAKADALLLRSVALPSRSSTLASLRAWV